MGFMRNILEWNKLFIYLETRGGLIPMSALHLPMDIWKKTRKEFIHLSLTRKFRGETFKKGIQRYNDNVDKSV